MWNNAVVFEKKVLVEKYDEYRSVQIRCKQIDEEIIRLRELRSSMVGTLYTKMVDDEICKLEQESEKRAWEVLSKMATNNYD